MDSLNNVFCRFDFFVKVSVFVICVMHLTSVSSSAQNGLIPQEYLQIIPGISTRADVEKLFPNIGPNNYSAKYIVDFIDKDLAIGIQYSSGSCSSWPLGWDFLPEWTVQSVSYNWPKEDKILLNDIILVPRQFEKRHVGDVSVHDQYVNDESGIKVIFDRKFKTVKGIYLEPSAKLKEKYKCQQWK